MGLKNRFHDVNLTIFIGYTNHTIWKERLDPSLLPYVYEAERHKSGPKFYLSEEDTP